MEIEKVSELTFLSESLTMLFSEDEKNVQAECTDMLSVFFKNIEIADDGEEALEKYQKYYENHGKYFDVLITDLNMPNMDGISLIHRVKEINPEQKIIVLSAHNNPERLITLLNSGVNYFIQKPVILENVINVLYDIVKNITNANMVKEFQDNIQLVNQDLEIKIKEKTKELHNKLYYDLLTGLPKRNKLFEDIEFYDPSALLVINIKEFKDINGVYGSNIGDDILKKFAQSLKAFTNEDYLLYSLGGDAFVILNINTNPSPQECIIKAIEITSYIYDNPISIDLDGEKIEVHLSVTIGISTCEYDDLLSKANLALKYAVQKRLPYIKYSDSLGLIQNSSDDIYWTKEIKKAIMEDRVVPFFQPIVSKSGEVKYESLIRIVKDEKVISPFFFLEVAKKTRQYTQLTKIMIEKSFKYFEKRTEPFSINLTFEDIADPKFLEFFIEIITKFKVQSRLIVEIVESESIDDFELFKNFISVMRMLDVKIAIDDFGSGYSNFAYLVDLKPNFIKIDGSIVKNIDKDESSFKITQTIVDFAKRLEIKTVAEYVHSKEVLDILKELDVDCFQGFYLSEPLKNIDDFKLNI